MGKLGKETRIIVLTACIRPKGMAKTALQNEEERKEQYIKALSWYLENTTLPILFVENSNIDISLTFENYIKKGRLEMLTFNGNDYPKHLGKGYGEALILKHALANSKLLNSADYIIKITGRLILPDINKILSYYSKGKYACLHLGRLRYWKDKKIESKIMYVHKSLLNDYFLPQYNKLNDSEGYTFERLLYDSCRQWIENGNKLHVFYRPLRIIGHSGTTGKMMTKPTIYMKIRIFLSAFLFNFKIKKLER